jgi:hypothetical protein
VPSITDIRRGVADALEAAAEERDRNGYEVIAPDSTIAVSTRDDDTYLHMRDGRTYLVTVTEVER